MKSAVAACLGVFIALVIAACEREERDLHIAAEASRQTRMVAVTDFRPGGAPPPAPVVESPFRDNAYALSEGKRLFTWFNCVGCHLHGGGGIGPALMDGNWIYGGRPEQIYASIVQGRPNGMPSFADKIAELDRWRLVAYVQSLSGQVPTDAAPGRDDAMSTALPESRRSKEPIRLTGSLP